MIEVSFTKMHGLGNDYIYFTEMPCPPEELPQLSRRLSDRHCGIGSDGIILALPSSVADFKMRIFNADGSEAKMCGNGARCVGRLVSDLGLTDKSELTLETLGGIKHLKLLNDGHVAVDMGSGVVSPACRLQGLEVIPVSVGNPHGVVFINEDPAGFDVHSRGAELEVDPYFPDRANIEFAQVLDHHSIKMRVWERGSGETMACGTGACATALAAYATKRTSNKVKVSLPGGNLKIEITDGHRILMTGPATRVFTGKILI